MSNEADYQFLLPCCLFYSLSAANDHLIDQTVGFGFLCAHVIVALRIRLDHFQWLAGVGCQDLIQFLLRLQDVLRDNAGSRSPVPARRRRAGGS